MSASRSLADVERRGPDGATAPSNLPSCAGETMLAPESAKRRVKNLAESARRTSRVLVVDEEEERDSGGHETLFS